MIKELIQCPYCENKNASMGLLDGEEIIICECGGIENESKRINKTIKNL